MATNVPALKTSANLSGDRRLRSVDVGAPLRELASSSSHLELTTPLNPLTLTRRAPELECCVIGCASALSWKLSMDGGHFKNYLFY
jgi:hypothetical protein